MKDLMRRRIKTCFTGERGGAEGFKKGLKSERLVRTAVCVEVGVGIILGLKA